MNKIIQGDCLKIMKTLPENSVDSIVTDPPYELGFMGKSWDNTGIAYNVDMWREALRVLKPGGHLLSFGGTRTYHRMACAIEDAGFEVRDMVSWIYGSGFPKSLNIGKAVDKLQGNEREVLSTTIRTTHKKGTSYEWAGGNDTGICDNTKGTSEWEGWGTALKPACEPCVLARKPLSEKTVALNVLKWGTGGINIDGSRVETTDKVDARVGHSGFPVSTAEGSRPLVTQTLGRFPANILHDGSDEVLEVFPNTKGGVAIKHNSGGKNIFSDVKKPLADDIGYGDSGSAARFFYCAKTSKNERNKGCEELEEKEQAGSYQFGIDSSLDGNKTAPRANNHPTVKPQALMKYLITLVTPKGGTVLDPFAGSGSTLVAAKELGFGFIGIELTTEYIPIIEARTGIRCERF